ncbi:hypothetical protein L195_g042483 [Trifolium pratense]|uniref:Uncharacterized protein n=1 Tax=Trifolium pratense TaxID=57577 RepID=A0A2K3M6K6_TRIPR|nr:hypothetical protein L195_g042483 [Trifolium pratense]
MSSSLCSDDLANKSWLSSSGLGSDDVAGKLVASSSGFCSNDGLVGEAGGVVRGCFSGERVVRRNLFTQLMRLISRGGLYNKRFTFTKKVIS